MTSRWFGVLALSAAMTGMVGCSSDSDSGRRTALTACNAYCDAASTAKCANAPVCKADECAELGEITGACETDIKAYYDCMKAQTNVCSYSCPRETPGCAWPVR